MMDYEFVIKEPWLLDEYDMPDIERGLLVRMTNDQSGEMFPLKSVHEILINTLEYYRRQKIPFAFEIHGLNSIVRMRFISLVAVAIGKDMGRATFITYERDDSDREYFTLHFDYIDDDDGIAVTDINFNESPILRRTPAFVLELLGPKKIGDDVFEYLTVLYDRQRQKHGFVRFIDSNYYLEMLEQELLIKYLDVVDTYYYYYEEEEKLELDDIDEEH